MKYRVHRNRRLMITVIALINLALFHKIGVIMTAVRTEISIRPTKLFQELNTTIFGLKTFLKLKKTDFAIILMLTSSLKCHLLYW
ncbi:MAG: hypothetical protein WCU00_10870 [Candidatus Latescibacterota bacterium]